MSYRVAIGPSSFAEEDKTPRTLLEAAGVEVIPNPYGRRLDEAEIIALLNNVDGLIAGLEPLNRRVLASAPRLKALARVGVGMSNVDLAAAKELGIKVSNTPEGPTESVAEMTLAALLALARQLIPSNTALHAGKWLKIIGFGLCGIRVLLIGYGRIGRRVGQLLHFMGAEVLVDDPYIETDSLEGWEQKVSLEEGLRSAQVISLHAAGSKELLGTEEFKKMTEGVILLNSARGELVNEDALIQALDSGKVGAAWFDAFWKEPYQGRLTGYEQVLLTPHAGTYTRQCRLSMEVSAVRNLLRDLGITA
jgi:D-3-phosphoglycerate dehydrogenase